MQNNTTVASSHIWRREYNADCAENGLMSWPCMRQTLASANLRAQKTRIQSRTRRSTITLIADRTNILRYEDVRKNNKKTKAKNLMQRAPCRHRVHIQSI